MDKAPECTGSERTDPLATVDSVDTSGSVGTVEAVTTRVFLLDDHEIVRRGVADLVNAEADLEVVGEAGSAAETLAAVARAKPDVAVLDVRLEDGNGIEVCREIRSQFPDVACLILTSFADDQALVDASMAGAAGYVLKQIRSNDLVESIRKAATGAQLLDSATVRHALQRVKNSDVGLVDSLTPQEHKIFDLIGEGYSNRQIADELFLAEKTVKNYVSNMLAKLGMSRRTEAAAFAARLEERQRRKYD
ncbi:MAG: two-component system response regulator DevR [Acidimicrobiales bacterium]|jgi:two-component system response regulator DevR